MEQSLNRTNWCPTDEVLREVKAERERQDAKWGGPEHDDEHVTVEWVSIVYRLLEEASTPGQEHLAQFRKAMIQIAATATAAVESLDRKNPAVKEAMGAADMSKHPMFQPPPEIRDAAKPDDLREAGWMVAIHSDLTTDGKGGTYWLITMLRKLRGRLREIRNAPAPKNGYEYASFAGEVMWLGVEFAAVGFEVLDAAEAHLRNPAPVRRAETQTRPRKGASNGT